MPKNSPKRITPDDVQEAPVRKQDKDSNAPSTDPRDKQIADLVKQVEALSRIVQTALPKAEGEQIEKPVDSGLMAKIIDKKDMERKKLLVEKLEKQPKMMIMIPPDGKANSTHEVGINGVVFVYPKGRMLEVPETVGKLLAEHFNITAAAGAEFRMDRNEDVMSKLS